VKTSCSPDSPQIVARTDCGHADVRARRLKDAQPQLLRRLYFALSKLATALLLVGTAPRFASRNGFLLSDPFIEFECFWAASIASVTALQDRQLADSALLHELLEHSAQGVGLNAEMDGYLGE
jgi:hypothetical protein